MAKAPPARKEEAKMNAESRRRFLMRASQLGAASLVSTWSGRRAIATPRVGAVGIQLYTVNIAMQDDPGGTLKKLRKIGFREVESAGLGKLSASQFRQLLDDAGLPCP
ncbi:MAG TPA: hypothetical protein VE052_09750, partial [Gemmatimonadaceae bacterium]|nr:hypothetical protein [Gemmatimonadaceae bacterium]